MIKSPFGNDTECVYRLHSSDIERRYREDLGMDVTRSFLTLDYIELYRDVVNGYKFWYPSSIAGDELFYEEAMKLLAPHYYRETRWEYQRVDKYFGDDKRILEIGSGRGDFLNIVEKNSSYSVGLELNREAIKTKHCLSPLLPETVEEHSKNCELYDVVCSFQVLEHIAEPHRFLLSSLKCLRDGGHLILSVPNDEFILHQKYMDPLNLPPHHLGCYSEKVFRSIAKNLDLNFVSAEHQPPSFPQIHTSESAKNSKLWRSYYRIFSAFGSRLLRFLGEPGHTLLVVLQK